MSIFATAASHGYDKIAMLTMLMQKNSKISSAVQKAAAAGYTIDQIMKIIERLSPDDLRKTIGNQNESAENIYRKGNKLPPGIADLLKTGAAAAGVLGGIGAISSSFPKEQQQTVTPSIPQIPPNQPQQALPAPQNSNPLQQGMQQQAVQRAIPYAGIPQSTQQIATQAAQQPQAPMPIVPKVNSLELVQKANLMPHIQALQKNLQDPKQISGVLFTQFPKEMQQLQKEAAKPMEDVIAEAMQAMPQQQEIKQPVQASQAVEPKQIEQSLQQTEMQPEKLSKGSKVVTPSGEIGEIERISGNTAQMKGEDGKFGAKLDKIEPITPEVTDVLENYKRLIESIPEEYKSGPLNFIGYDADRRKLSFRYNSGDQYVYEDIPEDEANAIAEALHMAKTTGQNFYGSWSPGDPSRGAGAHKLIMELQKKYGGKGKEYSAKFKTLYDLLALPKQLLAEENKRIAEEEKRKKYEERVAKARAQKAKRQ